MSPMTVATYTMLPLAMVIAAQGGQLLVLPTVVNGALGLLKLGGNERP